MTKQGGANDPKALIYEAYRIDGITKPDCRTIFLDWALSLPVERPQDEALRVLLSEYGTAHPDHPMTEVLREGQQAIATPRRRGGWRSRAGRSQS
ncbi:hypothetical protein [Tateyamaria sp. SN6-1]|uniref:hypothetical protein n=1 Tax=Tateyamaria sp. SN6-1 TaxID=3092148 RepID=UPI0039F635C3